MNRDDIKPHVWYILRGRGSRRIGMVKFDSHEHISNGIAEYFIEANGFSMRHFDVNMRDIREEATKGDIATLKIVADQYSKRRDSINLAC